LHWGQCPLQLLSGTFFFLSSCLLVLFSNSLKSLLPLFFFPLLPRLVPVRRSPAGLSAFHFSQGQDAEFKNGSFLLRTWLNPLFSYCVRLFRFLFFFWLGSLSQPGLLQPLNGPAGPLRCYRFALGSSPGDSKVGTVHETLKQFHVLTAELSV
jgi:hypothetical protein